MTAERDPLPERMERWQKDGTWDRLARAHADRATVKIRRSSGGFVDGIIVEVNVRCIVAWGPRASEYELRGCHYHFPPGVSSKAPLVDELLEWNPWLGPDEVRQ